MLRLLLLSFFLVLNINASIVGASKGKFSVSQGNALYDFEIILPKGTAGFKPSLSINYNSANNFNGLLGTGFSLSGLSQISQCNQKLISEKKNSSRNYNYCLDGQQLVTKSSSTSYGSSGEYKTEIDTYSKILKDSTGWVVYTKDGLIHYYGKTSDSKDSNLFFRVNKIKDRYNNEINYIYDTLTKALLKITYANNQIDLIYESRTDTKELYSKSLKINLSKRLKTISIKTNSSEIYRYNLNYQTINKKSILNSISETISGKQLKPINFKWNNFKENTFTKKSSFPSSIFPQGKKSKYYPADYNGDGIIDIASLNHSSSYSWIALSNANGTFTKKNSFSGYSITELTKYLLADYNGDGLPDIVAVNHKSYKSDLLSWVAISNGDGTFTKKEGLHKFFKAIDISNAVYDYDYYMNKSKYYTHDFNGDGLTDILTLNPLNKNFSFLLLSNGDGSFTKNENINNFIYHKDAKINFGDFNGDGFTDIASFYDNHNGLKYNPNEDENQKYSWIALSNGNGTFTKKTSLNGQFMSHESSKYFLSDFNSDGLTDIISYDSNYSQYNWIALSKGDGNFTIKQDILNQNLPSLNSWDQDSYFHSNDYKNLYLGDFNGDGVTDIALIDTSYRHNNTVALSKGDGTFIKKDISQYRMNEFSSISLIDYNGDGITDIMSTNHDKALYRYILISNANGTFTKKDLSTELSMNEDSKIVPADYNNDGLTDIAAFNYENNGYSWMLQSTSNKFQLSSITNEKDEKIDITYSDLYDNTIYSSSKNLSYPNRSIKKAPIKVVKSYTLFKNSPDEKKISYKYKNFALNLERGSLGFEEVEVFDNTTQTKVISIFNQTYPYIGTSKNSKTYVKNKLLAESFNYFTNISRGLYSQIYLNKKIEKNYDYSTSNILTTKTTTNTNIDSYGNIGVITTATQGNSETFKKTIYNTYSNYPSTWILSRLTKSKVVHEAPEQNSITRESKFEYNSSTGTLIKEIIEPHNTKSLSKSYTYDSQGNKISETISALNIEPRTTTYTYDSYGKNRLRVISSLGHIQKNTYNSKNQLSSVTGPNNLTSSFDYDEMGRKIKETKADGNFTTWQYAWTDNGHKVTQKFNNQFPIVVYYDALGRKIKTEKIGFDGRKIFEDIIYNNKGNKSKVSTPYFEGETPLYINYFYDDINRLIKVDSPAAHDQRAIDKIAYTPFSTVKTNAKNQIKTTTINAIEKVISVNDNNQSNITYKYDAIGNLIKTIDSENNEILIKYDIFGNKTEQNDPDMGIWKYNYNALKQLISQTDAKNQTTSFTYDKLGRVLTKTTPEGIIQFKYDIGNKAIGKIVEEKGIGSTKKYTYDNLGRVSTITTTIDDIEYTKQYLYDSLGRVIKTIEPNNIEIKNNYNTNGYLESITTPRKNAGGVDPDIFKAEIAYDMEEYLKNKRLAVEYTAKINRYKLDVIRYAQIINLYKNDPTKADTINQLKNHVNELNDLIYTLEGFVENYNTTTNTLNEANLQQWLNASQSEELASLYETFKNDLLDIAKYSLTLLEELKQTPLKLLYCGNVDGIIIFCPDTMSHDSTSYTKEDNILFYGTSSEIITFYEKALADLTKDVNYIKNLEQKENYYNQLAEAYNYKSSSYTEILESDEIYFYKVIEQNSLGITTSYLSGNGLETKKEYDERGILYSIKTGYESSEENVRNSTYTYDIINNVTNRTDHKLQVEQDFIYDSLNRLRYANINEKENSYVLEYQYDSIGNMTYKSDLGYYNYNSSRPHAVTNIADKTFTYDANGNMIKNDDKTITYTSFNKPNRIQSSSSDVEFYYDANNSRYKKTSNYNTTHYLNKTFERHHLSNGAVEDKYLIHANGKLVSVFSKKDENYSVKFLHYDNLGSIDTITNNLGVVEERYSYKPFGEKIAIDENGNAISTPTKSTTNRGFTGHEHIEEVGLIHMNGRVYDPTIARFLSADPHIQDSKDTQSYNRYTYVKNNPLKYTDPSGFFFKKIKKWIRTIVAVVVVAIVSYFTAGLASAWVASWGGSFINGALYAAVGITELSTLGAFAAGAIAGAVGGFVSGAIMTGSLSGALKGAAFGALGGGIAGAIGNHFGHSSSLLNGGGANAIKKAIVHGISRAAITKLQGGRWSAGFWSGFMTSAFSPGTALGGEGTAQGFTLRTTIASVIGGTVSEITGGKFANGAVTGAFVHMFNAEGRSFIDKTINSFSDLAEGFFGIPKILYAYGDYLGRLSGFRDWQEDSILPWYKMEAHLEYRLTIYAIVNHYDKIIPVIWDDMISRPNYYIGGSLVGGLSGSAATGAGIAIIHKAGSISNFVHKEANPLH